MKAADLRQKSASELQEQMVSLLREQFNLRMQRGSGNTIRPHILKSGRRTIARIKTLLRERMQDE
jgi:large subunit ribosomal protein L29